MNNVTLLTTINMVFCLLHASALRAETIADGNESNLGGWLFLIFCSILIVSQVFLAIRFMFGSPKKQSKDQLQKKFRKRLAH